MKRLLHHRSALLAIGLVVGTVIGLNLRSLLPSVPLHASATEGHENFAIATGLIDERVEGLYFLDYVTGNLMCAVVDPKTGQFNAFFRYNILEDFGSGARENPRYLMVTGLANMARGRGNFQVGKSIVYIAEATTGQVAAYAVPWNSPKQSAGKIQGGVLVKLGQTKFRGELRD